MIRRAPYSAIDYDSPVTTELFEPDPKPNITESYIIQVRSSCAFASSVLVYLLVDQCDIMCKEV